MRLTKLTNKKDLDLKRLELASLGSKLRAVPFEGQPDYENLDLNDPLYENHLPAKEELKFRQLQAEIRHLKKLLDKN